ncbi:MAG: FecR domain-containing protein [Chitinophagaceae bacterium]|nr:FecR domain-containing protein [Chitinophagaceae bacterium]
METASDEELRELFALIESYPKEEDLEDLFIPVFERIKKDVDYKPEEWESVVADILNTRNVVPITARRSVWQRWWVAASVAAIALSLFLWLPWKNDPAPKPGLVMVPAEIPPASDGAMLTLADGSQILLDTVKDGPLVLPGGVVAKVSGGKIVYEGNSETTTYNTVTTPNGRQFRVVLPDASVVWMNTSSSLRYPTRFTESERRVELWGEAYFEVSEDAKKPFYVSINNESEVEVLGTKFNVNAYDNEPMIQTTLLQGKVRVNARSIANGSRQLMSQAVLTPGQQAQIEKKKVNSRGEPVLVVERHANLEQVMAWRNGVFHFDGMSLAQVARQLERWYDVEVQIQKGMQDIRFGGSISNQISLQQLLKELEFMGIRGRLEGERTLIVSP